MLLPLQENIIQLSLNYISFIYHLYIFILSVIDCVTVSATDGKKHEEILKSWKEIIKGEDAFKNVTKPGKALYGSIIWAWREEFSDNDGLTKAGFLVFRKVTGRRYTRVLGPRPPRQRCSGGEGKFTKTRETEFWWFTILNWNLRKKSKVNQRVSS